MFKYSLVVILCLCHAAYVRCDERKILSITDGVVNCGPTPCNLNETHMCFYTSKFNVDSNNSTSVTTCGTCLSAKGSVIRESCSSEPSTLTNYTDTMSISLLNSTIEKDQFKNKIIALLLNEMANGSSPYPNQMLSSPYGAQQQPIIVVQPPAQQIYFNQPPSYDRGYSYDSSQRSGQNCIPPDCIPSQRRQFVGNQPNGLPAQLNEMYNLIDSMKGNLNRMNSVLQDAAAGGRIGYLDDQTKYPLKRNPFPVWSPVGK